MTLTESYWPADTSSPITDTTVGDLLRDAAADNPTGVAFVEGMPERSARRRVTYEQLLEASEQTARALLGRFEPGERVAVWGGNTLEWLTLEFGCALAGITLVTVNPAYKPQELHYVLSQSEAAGLFSMEAYRGNPMRATVEQVRGDLPDLREVEWLEGLDAFRASGSPSQALPTVTADDPAWLLYTSGTTGFPKGALLHHRGITNDSRLWAERLGFATGDVYVTPMPFFHAGGALLGLGPVHFAGTHVALHIFDPALFLELIESERADIAVGVPTMLIALMEQPDVATRDVSKLRAVVSGAASVPADLVRNIESTLGVHFSIVFGQTECTGIATMVKLDDSAEDKAETVGQALPQIEIKVTDVETGAIVAPGVLGEICIRGYAVMTGYFGMPDATAAAIDQDGWLHTGDLGTMDERGFCRIQGRLKDMIIRGGENIYPREIEAALFEHPAVGDVSVVGVPDDRWGEQVAAFVRLAPGVAATHQELFAHVRERLAHYKAPKYWRFVDDFPLTPSGKIQKFVLRQRWEKGEFEEQS